MIHSGSWGAWRAIRQHVAGLTSDMAAVAPSNVEPAFQQLADALNGMSGNLRSQLSDPVIALSFAAGLSTEGA